MGDLIKAVEALRFVSVELIHTVGYNKALDDVINLIRQHEAQGVDEGVMLPVHICEQVNRYIQPAQVWQSIDSAPEMMRLILTFNGTDVYTGEKSNNDGLWYDGSWGVPYPTHWMPLPQAPALKEEV